MEVFKFCHLRDPFYAWGMRSPVSLPPCVAQAVPPSFPLLVRPVRVGFIIGMTE